MKSEEDTAASVLKHLRILGTRADTLHVSSQVLVEHKSIAPELSEVR